MNTISSLNTAANKETPADRFARELGAASTLEEIDAVRKPDQFPFDKTVDIWNEHNIRIMKGKVDEAKTPEDILEVQWYFADHQTYAREVQEYLGDKAREVFAKWRPPLARGCSVSWI